jgi:hypothetical protein
MRVTRSAKGLLSAAIGLSIGALMFGSVASPGLVARAAQADRNCPTANPVANQTTGVCYPTIQAAVTAAGPGNVLVVGPGTYHENVTIPAGKDGLVLTSRVGAKGTEIVGDLTGASVQSVVEIDANHVTLGSASDDEHGDNGRSSANDDDDGGRSGFTISNTSTALSSGYDIHGVGIGFGTSSGLLSGVTVEGNVVENLVGTLPATTFGRVDGIAATNTANAAIKDNKIGPWIVTLSPTDSNVFTYGVLFFGTNLTPTVRDNSVARITEAGGLAGGMPFQEHEGVLGIAINDATAGASIVRNQVVQLHSDGKTLGVSASESVPNTTVDIANNDIDHIGSSTGSSAGVIVNPGTPSTAVTVERNDLAKDGYAIVVVANASGSHANQNNFNANGVGVADADGTFDATRNWWGCSGGPAAAGCDTAIGAVTFTPWLTHPAQTNTP